jgi:hypothetical protein
MRGKYKEIRISWTKDQITLLKAFVSVLKINDRCSINSFMLIPLCQASIPGMLPFANKEARSTAKIMDVR